MSKESILGSLKNMRKNLKNRATALETVGAVLLTSLPAFLGISAFLNIMVDHQQFQNYLFLAESIVSGIGIIYVAAKSISGNLYSRHSIQQPPPRLKTFNYFQ